MGYRPLFFDTETTGVHASRDKIIEIAAYDPVRGRVFEALINPGMPIPSDATYIHQITDEMVKDAEPFEAVCKRFFEFCDGDVALVAHNGDAFDIPFMKAECARCNLVLPSHWLSIDSLKWARRYRKDLPRHSLQYLRQTFGIKENKAHRALNDVMVLYEVYTRFVDDLSCEEVYRLLQKGAPKGEQPAVMKKVIEESYVLFK